MLTCCKICYDTTAYVVYTQQRKHGTRQFSRLGRDCTDWQVNNCQHTSPGGTSASETAGVWTRKTFGSETPVCAP